MERVAIALVTELEALGKHLRRKLLLIPVTQRRRKKLEGISFQRITEANGILEEIFDLGFFERSTVGSNSNGISEDEKSFINLMLQKRHVLVHNGGIADETYINKSGDTATRIDERIGVLGWEAERFLKLIEQLGNNFIANVEQGLLEAE